jgi:hypothetical protein
MRTNVWQMLAIRKFQLTRSFKRDWVQSFEFLFRIVQRVAENRLKIDAGYRANASATHCKVENGNKNGFRLKQTEVAKIKLSS